jgi:hypothetical protein
MAKTPKHSEEGEKKVSKAGQPSKYTPEIIEEICERLSKGEPMAVICRDKHMPAYRTVKDWMDEQSERGEQISAAIARAREEGFDAIALECLTIADDNCNDTIYTEKGEIPNKEWILRSKLRVETRLKLLAKWDPKRYGDKLEVNQKNINYNAELKPGEAQKIKDELEGEC